jgi:hypothetical protein
MSTDGSYVLLSQIPRLPLLAIFVAAIIVAFRRRQTLGSSWLFTAAGCAIWSFLWLVTPVFIWLQTSSDSTARNMGVGFAVFQYVSTFLDMVGTVLVLIAALRLGQKGVAAGSVVKAA